jgi:hypothetical protein
MVISMQGDLVFLVFVDFGKKYGKFLTYDARDRNERRDVRRWSYEAQHAHNLIEYLIV